MQDEVYLVVKSIDLLTIAEAEKLPENIRNIDDRWWLQSRGYSSTHAACVEDDGSVYNLGCAVDHDDGII